VAARTPSRRPALSFLQVIRSVLYRTKIIDISVGVFLGSVLLAIALYPGGTWWDPKHHGHHFWENYLCDLLHRRSLSGLSNLVGARVATAGLLILGLGIVTAFSLSKEAIPSRKQLGRRIAWCGSLGTLLLSSAILFPSDAHPKLHAAGVIAGSIPTILAFAVLVGALLLEPVTTRWLRAVSLGLLVLSVSSLSLYVWNVLFKGPSLRISPAIERVATIVLLVWLLMVSNAIRQRLISTYLALSKRIDQPNRAQSR
jgi:hypothetical protein